MSCLPAPYCMENLRKSGYVNGEIDQLVAEDVMTRVRSDV
jgi:hypothetical protein